jgi:hypothetical protein
MLRSLNKNHNKIIVYLIGFIVGIALSVMIRFYLNSNYKPVVTNNTAVSPPTTTIISLPNNMQFASELSGILTLNSKKNIQYIFLRESFIKDPKRPALNYDIELKNVTDGHTELTKDEIKEIVNYLIPKITRDLKLYNKVDLCFFSDKKLIEKNPFDIAFAEYDPQKKDIVVILRNELNKK